ncbi:MAG: MraY family glycosyltransferase [Chitinophagales bacterium]|nr:MraY family glycosyltransferase [Chitinophagales bacterium]
MIEEKYLIAFLLIFFCIAVFFSFLINWLFLKFSFNLGSRNKNLAQERWSTKVKPAIGGISFFIVFLISISVIGTIPREAQTFLDKKLIGLMAASSLGFLLGLADDAYNTNPLVKFIGQLSCAYILIVSDVYIRVFNIDSLDYLITVLWVIGLMNSINMLDNMDAITASVSACIIVGMLTVILSTGYINANLYLVMLVGVLGSLMGFLYFNWHPSKIYMGDTGSQFLGVFLAASSIIFIWGFRDYPKSIFEIKQFIVPMLLFIVPLIDTTTVTIRRLLRKQSPFVGGKDHITHHLAYLGLTDRQVALVLLGISLLSIPIVYLLVTGKIKWNLIVNGLCIAYFFLMFIIIQFLYDKGKKKYLSNTGNRT